MQTIPADIILLIFSHLPLFYICQLMKETLLESDRLQFYLKHTLLHRAKHEAWTIVSSTPSAYFAVLCNREILSTAMPIAQLTCMGYDSQAEYLRFEKSSPFQFELTDDEQIFQSLRIFCSKWFHLFEEDDINAQVKLAWREGDQTKQVGDMFITYRCTKAVSAERCVFCKRYSRCNRHAFLSTTTDKAKRLLEIQQIRVSLNWLKEGLIL